MDDNKSLKVTPLYEIHKEMDARMAPFGGFEMPIQYTGILEEHSAAREEAAIFDTCHMGEFIISGSESQKDLERLLSCSISAIDQNRCKYGFITNPQGGVIDDMIIYRKGDREFLMVVNAGTKEKDYNWIFENISEGTQIRDISENTAKIDIQGPKAPEIIEKMVERSVQGLKFFEFMDNTIGDTEILLSRTGYTGEVGFEIFCDSSASKPIWRKATELG
ncbi:MAG: hypothetical protein ACOCSE_00495, partial [Chitinivibrionales bacterium]